MELTEFEEMLSEQEFYAFEEAAVLLAEELGLEDEEARVSVMRATLKAQQKTEPLVRAV